MEKNLPSPLLACDDAFPPRLISSWLLDIRPQEEPPLTFYSFTRRTTIDLKDLISFLTSDMHASEFLQKQFYDNHLEAINKIYQGESLGEILSNEMIELIKYENKNCLAPPTNTPLVDRLVKYCNEFTVNTKDDGLENFIAIICSTNVFSVAESPSDCIKNTSCTQTNAGPEERRIVRLMI